MQFLPPRPAGFHRPARGQRPRFGAPNFLKTILALAGQRSYLMRIPGVLQEASPVRPRPRGDMFPTHFLFLRDPKALLISALSKCSGS